MTLASAGGLSWWKVAVPLVVLMGFFLLPRGLVVGAGMGGLAGIALAPGLGVQVPGELPLIAAAFGGVVGYLVHPD